MGCGGGCGGLQVGRCSCLCQGAVDARAQLRRSTGYQATTSGKSLANRPSPLTLPFRSLPPCPAPPQGGLYAPSIFIGASLGTAFGLMAHAVGDPVGMTLAAPQAYALVGEPALWACREAGGQQDAGARLACCRQVAPSATTCGMRPGPLAPCPLTPCLPPSAPTLARPCTPTHNPGPLPCRAGVAAMLASNCSVPLTSVLLLFELTRDYLIILPTMAAVGIRCGAPGRRVGGAQGAAGGHGREWGGAYNCMQSSARSLNPPS